MGIKQPHAKSSPKLKRGPNAYCLYACFKLSSEDVPEKLRQRGHLVDLLRPWSWTLLRPSLFLPSFCIDLQNDGTRETKKPAGVRFL